MDNKTRMEKGMAYKVDETLAELMKQNKMLLHKFNNVVDPWEFEQLIEIAHKMFGALGDNAWINPPFIAITVKIFMWGTALTQTTTALFLMWAGWI